MGIFGSLFGGNRQPPLSGPVMPRGPMDPAFIPPAGQTAPDPSNRVFGRGDIGGIIGGLGKILSYGPFVGMAQEGMNRRRHHDDIDEAYKAAQIAHLSEPERTPLQKNYEYLKQMNPALAEQFLRAQANPMTLMTNPTTGQIGFYPKGGMPGATQSSGPATQVIDGKTYYQINGEWYDNPEGR